MVKGVNENQVLQREGVTKGHPTLRKHPLSKVFFRGEKKKSEEGFWQMQLEGKGGGGSWRGHVVGKKLFDS